MKRKYHLPFFMALLFIGCYYQSSAQLFINEFMASNTGVFVDPDYDQSADWIEIYNSGTNPVQLNGYYFTDNLNDKTKWQITSNFAIQAGQYLIIWADGNNAGLHANFKLTATGEELAIVSPSLVVLDSIVFGNQEPNISMGRKSTGSNNWVFYTEPTPGQPNNTTNYNGIVKSSPDFSVLGGIYHSPVSLKLTSLFGGDIRYTLDGSEPTIQSQVAFAPITISKNTVVRARIYKTAEVLGPIITNSFFIDPNYEINKLPIVSLSSAPENFWDSEKGIYVQNFKPDWEIPVNIELFENDGSDRAAFNLQAGVKVNGLYSWKLPQKMLGVYFRKEYGSGSLDYPIIFDKPRKSYDTFALRASGSDWGNTMFRDGMIQNSTMEHTDLDNSGFRACVVYINGEYMGVHNIREKIDEDYIIGNHGHEGGTFDMVEETDQGPYAETGDLAANDHFRSITAKDMTNQSNYDIVAAVMDIENFTDMVCTEVYSGNSSIGHNLMKWKPRDSGKWKWILMDLDRGFSNVSSQKIDFYINEDGWPFRDLMKNQDYKKRFGRRLADHLFTTFNHDRIITLIDKHAKTIEAEMPNHIERWLGTVAKDNYDTPISSFNKWLSEVEKLRTFAQGRPDVILNDLKNYGFQSHVPVSITTLPAKSGILTFNGLKIPVDKCSGGYPKGEEIRLVAAAKAGYKFIGWQSASNSDSLFIEREQVWKYSDTGIDLGVSWKNSDFNDSSWKTGQAEFGYGDGDEKTVISFGGNASNKFITSYFRKGFVLNNKQHVNGLTLLLKCDDGAVVYLNGNEIQRFNMPTGVIGFSTKAIDGITGDDETGFKTYSVSTEFLVDGNNVIGVEVHQNSASNSSDVSFDLELSAQKTNTGQYLSANKEYVISPQSALNISAVFVSDEKCIIPNEIISELTLNKACSPYVVSGDVQIAKTGKLNIEPGVEIWLSDGASIIANGQITAKGTKSEPIIFKGNPERANKKWGIISFAYVSDTSRFSNVIIEDASVGKQPVRELAAISAFHSVLRLDNITIENVNANPIASRYSDVSLINSRLHSSITGDLINIKYGKGYVENSDFEGNNMPDTDGIDYDDVENGVIRNCRIHDFHGFNSDAIDIGEAAKNILIDKIQVNHITDKGVSVGQRSSATISNSVFLNCNLGAGLKDSSRVTIDHCTYYGTNIAVATYEKNPGDAGANTVIKNSILSNSYDVSYLNDEYSTTNISWSNTDNDKLPDGIHNLFVNPRFTNPTEFDFSLISGSACIGAAETGNMGSGLSVTGIEPEIMISDIAYFTELGTNNLEFIGLYNPGTSRIDIGGYQFTKGITFTFPDGITIASGETFFVTSNTLSSFWEGKGAVVFQWESGRLADEGEAIQLINQSGMIVDQVKYNNKAPWPVPTKSSEAISLTRYDVDNHFGEYWKLLPIDDIVSFKSLSNNKSFSVFPNPSTGVFSFSGLKSNSQIFEVFSLQGKLVLKGMVESGKATINLSDQENGMYLIRSGAEFGKIMLIK